MKKGVKIWNIVASCLVCVGVVVMLAGLSSCSWDFSIINGGKYQTNTHEITEDFSNISIRTDTADIIFLESENENCKVVCYEEEDVKHSVSVAEGTLMVNVVDERKWYEGLFNFDSPKITVYLPEIEYSTLIIEESTGDIEITPYFKFKTVDVSVSTGDVTCYASATERVKIEGSTGDICVENISAGEVDITVSTGKVTVANVTCDGDIKVGASTGKTYLRDITCKNVISSGDTGDISLKNVVATDTFTIERDTGDVRLYSSDAGEIFIETDTGDVEGSLLSAKVFIIDTDTGDKDVPDTVTGGRCKITTDTGDVRIMIK